MARVKAFIKRILQVCAYCSVPFIAGCLYCISEVCKLKEGLWTMISVPEEDDDEERFSDDEGEGEGNDNDNNNEKDEEHNENGKEMDSNSQEKEKVESKQETAVIVPSKIQYDGRKREPEYSHADQTCLWELCQFAKHFHPTIALYSQTLLTGKSIVFPDSVNYSPLQNHTLARFLDRFVYKNPKKTTDGYRGSSLMQPRATSTIMKEDILVTGGKKRQLLIEGVGRMDDIPVNDKMFLKKDQESVPVDEVNFLFSFFSPPPKLWFFYLYMRVCNIYCIEKLCVFNFTIIISGSLTLIILLFCEIKIFF